MKLCMSASPSAALLGALFISTSSSAQVAIPNSYDAWGLNTSGQSSSWGHTADWSVQAVSAGHYHTLYRLQNGYVHCIGSNTFGQSAPPVQQYDFIDIAAGCEHSVACRAGGGVVCWGRNTEGQCTPPITSGFMNVAAGDRHSFALRLNGTIECWGANNDGQCNPPADLPAVTSIASGGAHGIVRTATGLAVCWGWNGHGQCDVPASLGSVMHVSGGGEHSAVVREDGSVVCWGSNAFGQCDVPADLRTVTAIDAGGGHTIALCADGSIRCWGWNQYGQCTPPTSTTGVVAVSAGGWHSAIAVIADGISYNPFGTPMASAQIATLIDYAQTSLVDVSPTGIDGEAIDYIGKPLELRCTGPVIREPSTTTIFAANSRLSANGALRLDGVSNVPTNANAVLASTGSMTIAGSTTVSLGGSILAQNDGSSVAIDGALTLATNAVFNPLSAIQLNGTLDILGGVVVSPAMTSSAASNLVAVNGTIDVDSLSLSGSATCLNTAVVANVSVASGAQLAASGQIVGNLSNNGRSLTTGDLVVVGNVANSQGSQILAQVGVLYITGNLVNNGIVVGNVITAPNFNGGGNTGGTQVGDGIRVAGSVEVGPAGELRFVEDLWKFSVCGDMTLACTTDNVRFNGAKLSLDGCDGTVQSFEATSRDLGCVASAFSGEETQVSLIGELDIVSGATVSLVDSFNNAAGKDAEVVYARGLTVQAGATLLTNGIKVVTRNALIQGTVDDPANICVVPDLPDPDVNGDGHVNGIDLAFILTYWGTNAPIADLDDDGTVGGGDLAFVLSGWTG